jgi:hypothetical protein
LPLPDKSKNSATLPVIVPLRNNRTFEWVDRFAQKYSHRINFQLVDFSKLTIAEQIKTSANTRGMFGCEGAAFANILFMQGNSCVVPVSNEPYRFIFHSSLAKYIGHRFTPVHLDSSGSPSLTEDDVLRFLEVS